MSYGVSVLECPSPEGSGNPALQSFPHCLWETFVLCLGSDCLVQGPSLAPGRDLPMQ